MASEVNIGNLALSRVGEVGNVSDFNEGSANADYCRMYYPIARDLLLIEGWSFNTKRVQLAPLATVPPSLWQYAYAAPALMLKAMTIIAPEGDERCEIPFITETGEDGNVLILTNQENAILRYAFSITDTTKFSPLFVDTLGWLLASYLAGSVLKGQEGIAAGRSAYQTYQSQLAHAQAIDKNQMQQKQGFTPSAIAARYGSESLVRPNFYEDH